jgi:hypothetical protein
MAKLDKTNDKLQGLIISCSHCSCLITTLRSGHRPLDLHHSKGRDPSLAVSRYKTI